MENSLVNTNLVSEQVLNVEYTVTALTIMIRKTVEGEFSGVLVVGEVSGYKLASSGHVYFTLKDDQNLIACVCWNSAFRKINFDLADGMKSEFTSSFFTPRKTASAFSKLFLAIILYDPATTKHSSWRGDTVPTVAPAR